MITVRQFENRTDDEHQAVLDWIDTLIAADAAVLPPEFDLTVSELRALRSSVSLVKDAYDLKAIYYAGLEGRFDDQAELAAEFAATQIIEQGLADELIKISNPDLLDALPGDAEVRFRIVADIFADQTASALVDFSIDIGQQIQALLSEAIFASGEPIITEGYKALRPLNVRLEEYAQAIGEDDTAFSSLLSAANYAGNAFATDVVEDLSSVIFIPSLDIFEGFAAKQATRKYYKLYDDFAVLNYDKILDRLEVDDNPTLALALLNDAILGYAEEKLDLNFEINPAFLGLTALSFIDAALPELKNIVISALGGDSIEVSDMGKNAFMILDDVDSAVGSSGVDIIIGGSDVKGKGGNDFISLAFEIDGGRARGGAGEDLIFGSNGNDFLLSGGKDNDSIWGYDGNDLLVGGEGEDELQGGRGIDTAAYSSMEANEGSQTGIDLTGSGTVIYDPIGDDFLGVSTFTGIGGDAQGDFLYSIEEIIGSEFNDVFTWTTIQSPSGSTPNLTVQMIFDGGAGIDTLNYSSGEFDAFPIFWGGSEDDVANIDNSSGAGNTDLIYYGQQGRDTLTANAPASGGIFRAVFEGGNKGDTLNLSTQSGAGRIDVTFIGEGGADVVNIASRSDSDVILVEFSGGDGADEFHLTNDGPTSDHNVGIHLADADSSDQGFIDGSTVASVFEITVGDAFEFWTQNPDGSREFSYNYGGQGQIFYSSSDGNLFLEMHGVQILVDNFEDGDLGITLPPQSPAAPQQQQFMPAPELVSALQDGATQTGFEFEEDGHFEFGELEQAQVLPQYFDMLPPSKTEVFSDTPHADYVPIDDNISIPELPELFVADIQDQGLWAYG